MLYCTALYCTVLQVARPGLGLLRITRAGDSQETEETLQAALGAWNLRRLRMNRLAKRSESSGAGAEHGDKEPARGPWSHWSLDPRYWRSMGMNRTELQTKIREDFIRAFSWLKVPIKCHKRLAFW